MLPPRERNAKLLDKWSAIHLATGVLFGWIMPPVLALTIMTLWEPLEILFLSPFLARHNIDFGYESLHNSLSDICVNTVGVLLGSYGLSRLVTAPFHLF